MLTNKAPWVVLLVLWMIGSTWWHVCKIKQLCVDIGLPTSSTGETELNTTPAGADGFTIADGNLFRLELPRPFSFARSDANVNMNALGGSIDPLIMYLKSSPGRRLTIVGYYAPDEKNTTSLANLGLARAEGIRQYLVQQGIPAASLTTLGEARNLPPTAKGDSLAGGLAFAFSGAEPVAAASPETELTELTSTETPPAQAATATATVPAATPPAPITLTESVTENELAKAQKFTSVFQPMDLYFQLGEASYIKTEETKKFFAEAIKLLSASKDKKLLLTGHTDNSGPDEVNRQLSLDRANEVKLRLRKAGISPEQITIKAKGESEPKADNSTMSGRKANRRVTVVVVE